MLRNEHLERARHLEGGQQLRVQAGLYAAARPFQHPNQQRHGLIPVLPLRHAQLVSQARAPCRGMNISWLRRQCIARSAKHGPGSRYKLQGPMTECLSDICDVTRP